MPSPRNTNNSRAASIHFTLNATSTINTVANVPPSPSSSSKCQKEDYVKRPMNAFMLFRSYVYNNGLVSDNHQNNISEMVAKMWRAMPEIEKDVWRQKAVQVKEEHRQRHPEYRFIPGRRASGSSTTVLRPKPEMEKEKATASLDASTSRPTTIPVTTQPEIPVFFPTRRTAKSEVNKQHLGDYGKFSDDDSLFDEVILPVTPTTSYDPLRPYQPMLIARTGTEPFFDPVTISYDAINEMNTKFFISMQQLASNTNDAPIDEEDDVDDEEIEKLMKQFLVGF